MKRTSIVCGLLLAFGAAKPALAQPNGSVPFQSRNVNAFAIDAGGFVSVSVEVTEAPWGTFINSVVNAFDFGTGQFTQCFGDSSVDLRVSKGNIGASFVTGPGGFNCGSGLPVSVSCEIADASGVFHDVTNGVASLGWLGQRYNTHGVAETYTSLECTLSALGTVAIAQGGAHAERRVTTP